MKLSLTIAECMQFQFLLPVQGNLKTLELVDRITTKVKVYDNSEIKDVEFEYEEIDFMKDMIKYLDENQKLYFQSISLIRKILSN